MEKNNKGKEILKLLQENYEIETAKNLSSSLKDMFKGALQKMMNAELFVMFPDTVIPTTATGE